MMKNYLFEIALLVLIMVSVFIVPAGTTGKDGSRKAFYHTNHFNSKKLPDEKNFPATCFLSTAYLSAVQAKIKDGSVLATSSLPAAGIGAQ